MKKLLIFIVLLMTACSNLNKKADYEKNKKDEIYEYYTQWRGTPYKLGGTDKSGIDCSAFVKGLFSDVYLVQLPRTTGLQMKVGKEIDYFERTTGDLVFFSTGKNVNHVGVYFENDNFIHASTSKGVMISNLNESYWLNNFIQIRRLVK